MEIVLVTNGQPTMVVTSEDDTLGGIIPVALAQTLNTFRPLEDWELRDTDGMLLDLETKVKDAPEERLFLNLKAGFAA